MNSANRFCVLAALVAALVLSSCSSSKTGGGNGALLPPDGYVFEDGDSGYFGEDYGHGSWDPDDSVANPSIDLPGEYVSATPSRSSSSASSTRTASSSRSASRSSAATVSSSKPSSSRSSAKTSGIYRVGKGDTLWGIARAHGTTVGAIRSANGLSSDTIYPGQKLRVSGSRVPSAPSVASSASASSSSAGSVSAPAPSAAPSRTHIVAKGDTLWGISRRYKVTVGAIKSANGMSSDLLRPGDSLRIP